MAKESVEVKIARIDERTENIETNVKEIKDGIVIRNGRDAASFKKLIEVCAVAEDAQKRSISNSKRIWYLVFAILGVLVTALFALGERFS